MYSIIVIYFKYFFVKLPVLFTVISAGLNNNCMDMNKHTSTADCGF